MERDIKKSLKIVLAKKIKSISFDNTLLKIFVSYSRRDAGDFAEEINKYLKGHDVFTETQNIHSGDIWSKTIEENITTCDIFIVIVTHTALESPEVEREVLQAQKEKKKIIPCIHKSVNYNEIKWGLEKIQGIKFSDENVLIGELLGNEQLYPIDSADMAKLPVWFDSTSFRKEEDNPILQSQPLKIERYPYARFPSIITLDEVAPLEIYIRTNQPTQFHKPVKLFAKPEDREIKVYVTIECSNGLEIIGEKYYGEIIVPIEKDSNPLIFYIYSPSRIVGPKADRPFEDKDIKAIQEGKETITISLYQEQTYVGELKVKSKSCSNFDRQDLIDLILLCLGGAFLFILILYIVRFGYQGAPYLLENILVIFLPASIVILCMYRRISYHEMNGKKPCKRGTLPVAKGWYETKKRSCCKICGKHPLSRKYHLKKIHNVRNVNVKDYFMCCGCVICIHHDNPYEGT